ncbi:hypothetical protein B2J93_2917 [Marssonina coronariae]|uniref:Uncharacterized protein n=1 Tax=Diplocarpon coronariae TaxID=2795749 RepID=A0A218YTK3_9HELO|nr:hypothetical protein B2J93_2917 [Marssonina coronariae]
MPPTPAQLPTLRLDQQKKLRRMSARGHSMDTQPRCTTKCKAVIDIHRVHVEEEHPTPAATRKRCEKEVGDGEPPTGQRNRRVWRRRAQTPDWSAQDDSSDSPVYLRNTYPGSDGEESLGPWSRARIASPAFGSDGIHAPRRRTLDVGAGEKRVLVLRETSTENRRPSPLPLCIPVYYTHPHTYLDTQHQPRRPAPCNPRRYVLGAPASLPPPPGAHGCSKPPPLDPVAPPASPPPCRTSSLLGKPPRSGVLKLVTSQPNLERGEDEKKREKGGQLIDAR